MIDLSTAWLSVCIGVSILSQYGGVGDVAAAAT